MDVRPDFGNSVSQFDNLGWPADLTRPLLIHAARGSHGDGVTPLTPRTRPRLLAGGGDLARVR
jgi:hypothetical protein